MVSIIIANWNGKAHLAHCLASLKKIDGVSFETIVVDNGSTDGSVEYLEESFPQVKIVQNQKNLGFAEANNQGFKKAKGKYILFLNNDTRVKPDFLKKLVGAMDEDEKIGVVQPKIIFMKPKKIQAAGDFLTRTGFLYHFGYWQKVGDPRYNQRSEIFSANGACMLARKAVIEKVGLFDPDFFAYFEETDFCWRVWLAGFKVSYIPESVIYHQGGQTAQWLKRNFVIFHSSKNRIASLIKNLGPKEFFKTMPVHFLFCQLGFLGFLIRRKFLNAWALQRAIGWNLLNLGKLLRKRKRVQNKIRRISDKILMPKILRSPGFRYFYYLFAGLEEYPRA